MNSSKKTRSEWSAMAFLQTAFGLGCFMTAAVARNRLNMVGEDDRLELGLLLGVGALVLSLGAISFIVQRVNWLKPKAAMLDATAAISGVQHVPA